MVTNIILAVILDFILGDPIVFPPSKANGEDNIP